MLHIEICRCGENGESDGRTRWRYHAAAYAENIRSDRVRSENFARCSLQACEGESHRPDKRKKREKAKEQEEPSQETYQQTQKGRLQGQPFQVTFFTDFVKKCHGCKRTFAARLRKVPNNVILKRLDRREFMDTDGKRRQSTQLQNTYYHLNLDCVQRNCPWAEPSHIVVHEEDRDKLTVLQKSYAERCGFHL